MSIKDQERRMASESRNELAMMVRNTQWSYAILWAVSSTQPGVIEWGEGYYNGSSKTESTSNSREADTNHSGLQRSEQLRNLYNLLLEGKEEQGKKRTSVTATVKDLSDLEWYYLLCMSFTFEFGQSLPGRAYTTGQPIWLGGTQSADSKLFTRSLLAKSASIQTVICFPHLRGVIELGSTDLISEDLKLIEHIVKTPRELRKSVCSQISCSSPNSTAYGNCHRGTTANENDNETEKLTALPSNYFTGEQMMSHQEIKDIVTQTTVEDQNISSPDADSFMLDSPEYPSQHSQLSHDGLRQILQDGFMSDAFDNRDSTENLNHRSLPVENVPFYDWEQRENEQFMILKSMLPPITKTQTDEPSVITIESPFGIEARLSELEFDMDLDIRKSSEVTGVCNAIQIEVSLANYEVLVEMKCPWREHLLLNIMKVLNNLNLDTHTVQSSTHGGVLFLSLKSKVRGAEYVSEATIKQALIGAVTMC